jgi:uncharacterized membrane protein YhhN
MTSMVMGLLLAAGTVALLDWTILARAPVPTAGVAAVPRGGFVTKPLVLLLLIAAALVLEPAVAVQRIWFVAALLLSLAGDVALLAPERGFLPGLGAFAAAHLAYIAGMLSRDQAPGGVAAGVVLVVLAASFVGVRIVVGAAQWRGWKLALPVGIYLAVISGMVVVAFGTANWAAMSGAVLLYASDAVLGWNRFICPIRRGRLLTRIPYHLGQAALLISLLG